MVEVRRAVPGDLAGLIESNAALFAEDPGRRDPVADLKWPYGEGRLVIENGISDPRRLVLVAVDDGALVGHLTGVLEAPSVMHMIVVANLRSIFVDAAYRSAGLGGRFVEQFLLWARESGAARVSVNAYVSNEAAVRFYRRHGFAPHEVLMIAPIA